MVKIERPYFFKKKEGTTTVEFVDKVHPDLEKSLRQAFNESVELWQKLRGQTDFLTQRHISFVLNRPHERGHVEEIRGQSAGLALAISFLAVFSEAQLPAPIVATGKLGRGKIESVEDLEAKLSGEVLAMPAGTLVFYPAGQRLPEGVAREARSRGIRLIGVGRLSDVLPHLPLPSLPEAPEAGRRPLKAMVFPALIAAVLSVGLLYYYLHLHRGQPRAGPTETPRASAERKEVPQVLYEQDFRILSRGVLERRIGKQLERELKGMVRTLQGRLSLVRVVEDLEPRHWSSLAVRLEVERIECPSGGREVPLPIVLKVEVQGEGDVTARLPEAARRLREQIEGLCMGRPLDKGFD